MVAQIALGVCPLASNIVHGRLDHRRRLLGSGEKREVASAERDDACINPPGHLPLQDGREHAIFVGNTVPGRLGMPRGFGDTIEKCADPNGLLRSGEDRGLRCRQVVRQKLEYCVRRKVENPPASTVNLFVTAGEGWPLCASAVDSPMSGAHAAM
jgi:hypothetical protein